MGKRLLKEISNITYGYAFDSKRFALDSSAGLPVIRIRDLKQGKSNTYTDEQCDDKYHIYNGDLLIGMDGEFNIVEWHGGHALLNQRVCKIESCTDELLQSFLSYSLSGELKHIESQTSYVTVKHLSAKVLNNITISLPSLIEQRKIINVLTTVNNEITFAKQMLAKADELIQSRFVEMFGDIQERTTVTHYVKSFSSGKSLASKERCINLVLKTSAVASNTFDETQVKYLPFDYVPNPDHEIKHGDVIINRKNTVQLVGSTGYVWQYPKNMYLSDLLWKANLDETTCNPIFLWQLLVNRSVHRRISAMATGANSSMANITKPNLMQLPVVLVPLALQNEFAEFVTQVESLKATARQQLDRLNTLYESLAQRYFAE
ncbi:restriction modification system DNA specificity domain-containing protein [Bifidobacterium hapali]|uniref:Restriction modification system DNA specificity domain-containing protein n=1 Tax=Bifidobacterium hapali TaxID=1630172 RepID=A0A261FYF3_9BIFI|nr:restriction endonuclease subunit S [Bifidobacterium hapali]OZG64138.1 restriction modification system DNA specificity domain-containing protein [Bifidobacterium hapali]